MGAVKNQPGLGAPDRLSARYGGVPVIYVESRRQLRVRRVLVQRSPVTRRIQTRFTAMQFLRLFSSYRGRC